MNAAKVFSFIQPNQNQLGNSSILILLMLPLPLHTKRQFSYSLLICHYICLGSENKWHKIFFFSLCKHEVKKSKHKSFYKCGMKEHNKQSTVFFFH